MVRIIFKKTSLNPVVFNVPDPVLYTFCCLSSYLVGELLIWISKILLKRLKRFNTERKKSFEDLRSADPAKYKKPMSIERGGADCIDPKSSWLIISEQIVNKLLQILNPSVIKKNGTTVISPAVFFLAYTIVLKFEFRAAAQPFVLDISNSVAVEGLKQETKKAVTSSGVGVLLLGALARLGPADIRVRILIAAVSSCFGGFGTYKVQKLLQDITCVVPGIVSELPRASSPEKQKTGSTLDENPIFIAPNPLNRGIEQFLIEGHNSHKLYEETETQETCTPEFNFKPCENEAECVGDLDKEPIYTERCTVRRSSSPLSERTATLSDIIKEDGSDIRKEAEEYTSAYDAKVQSYESQKSQRSKASERLKAQRIKIKESKTEGVSFDEFDF
jgi:hypothetical protein